MADNATNATTAVGNSMAASAFEMTSFGQPIVQENKPLHSSPGSTDAAAKPSIAAFAGRKSGSATRCPKQPTSLWTPPILAAILACWC